MTRKRYWKQMDQLVGKNLWCRRCYPEHNGSAIRITALTSPGPKWSPERRCRFETFKKMLVQTVPCQAAALDLRNGRAAVLALRQMRYENAVRLVTRNHIRALQIAHEFAEMERDHQGSHVATALQPAPKQQGRCNRVSFRTLKPAVP